MLIASSRSIIDRLDPACSRALDQAAEMAAGRGDDALDVEHFLLALTTQADCGAAAVYRRYGIDPARLADSLTETLERLGGGNGRAPRVSENVRHWLRCAWQIASLQFDSPVIAAAHLLLALCTDERLRGLTVERLNELSALRPDDLADQAANLIETSPSREPAGDDPLLDYATDLTHWARAGRLDPVIGRHREIERVVEILCRRRQNNAALLGDAGVGKTAVVEGLARKLVEGRAPEALRDARLLSLDPAALRAGAGAAGELDKRLRALLDAVRASVRPVVLFVDEAHVLFNPESGMAGAGHLLKPALARGELRMIIATTWTEHGKSIDKDAALSRRFETVDVVEPTGEAAVEMVRSVAPKLEAHHGVAIVDEAVADAVALSQRYLPDRRLPDKAIRVLDSACARVALSRSGPIAELDEIDERLNGVETRVERLAAEQEQGRDHAATIAALKAECEELSDRRVAVNKNLAAERRLIDELAQLRGANGRADLSAARARLEMLQADEPMVRLEVDRRCVAEVIGRWTGVALGRILRDETERLLGLGEALAERVVGQSAALRVIAERACINRANLYDYQGPAGVFLLAGPSGVGKTETARALAELCFGGVGNLLTINMSEYKEEHKVAQLMGAPPGYVGHGNGGLITDAVRRNPHSVILLDELEKAHRGVHEVFFQVFDKAEMRDGCNAPASFRDATVIMTTNAGSRAIADACSARACLKAEELEQVVLEALAHDFDPAFLGRVTVVPYVPLDASSLESIARIKLNRIARGLRTSFDAELTFDDGLVQYLVTGALCDPRGARMIEQFLTKSVLPALSFECLRRSAGGDRMSKIALGMNANAEVHVDVID